ncbi:metalloregulator ArsR/SmtB family transcription factor [Streptomyces sp. H10-C2]|uniref:ArsR/SmtB family transcription factor n=1 Tax=unclassified Streptomyces TaxID=2593676 RepID=UPI0024B9B1BF|nr:MULTISPECIES: metalloregulator ArsR/SmtB family transcription factor [unclassified Streptomyces]MDJ0345393.1 metalloregulator ArsR/SmtB family transcription factor [Streptomyces sp. PH10-H1]MDJ0372147.1 metalloregulator ArsR/SmtB family transcription factor [Streptomyces sp. H10-C2]
MTDHPTAPVAERAAARERCSHSDTVARFFRALSDPTRLRMLEFILAAERTSAECVEHTGISQPRVSVHLSCLVDCGYVVARRDGRKLRYSVGDPRVADLIVLARALAADSATALDCCTCIPPADRD